MIFQVRLAERNIRIISMYDKVYNMCNEYIIPPDCDIEPDFMVKMTKKSILNEMAIERNNNQHDIWDCKPMHEIDYLETLAVYREIAEKMPSFDTVLVHGSVISYKGQGYMFMAPSGVGKTTRTRLWLNEYPDSIVINGDKPLLRIDETSIYAYGTPWSGKEHWNTNASVPLKAVFLLERVSQDEKTSVNRIPFSEAFPFVFNQIYHPYNEKSMIKTISLLKGIQNKVKIYIFRSEATASAIRLAYETVSADNNG